jgi:hypothetical protein
MTYLFFLWRNSPTGSLGRPFFGARRSHTFIQHIGWDNPERVVWSLQRSLPTQHKMNTTDEHLRRRQYFFLSFHYPYFFVLAFAFCPYYTRHPAVFAPAIPAGDRPQILALDRSATRIRTCDPNNREAADLSVRPHGHEGHDVVFFFLCAQQPNAGQGRLILEVSASHKMTHHSR